MSAEDKDGLYSWVGPPISQDAKRLYFPAMMLMEKSKDRKVGHRCHLICVGQKVFVHNKSSDPFIAEIQHFYHCKDSDKMRVILRWMYRVQDASKLYAFDFKPRQNELFYSAHEDDNLVTVIQAPCYVVFLADQQTVPNWAEPLQYLFICRSELQFKSDKQLSLLPIPLSKLQQEYNNIFILFPRQFKELLKKNIEYWSFVQTNVGDIERIDREKNQNPPNLAATGASDPLSGASAKSTQLSSHLSPQKQSTIVTHISSVNNVTAQTAEAVSSSSGNSSPDYFGANDYFDKSAAPTPRTQRLKRKLEAEAKLAEEEEDLEDLEDYFGAESRPESVAGQGPVSSPQHEPATHSSPPQMSRTPPRLLSPVLARIPSKPKLAASKHISLADEEDEEVASVSSAMSDDDASSQSSKEEYQDDHSSGTGSDSDSSDLAARIRRQRIVNEITEFPVCHKAPPLTPHSHSQLLRNQVWCGMDHELSNHFFICAVTAIRTKLKRLKELQGVASSKEQRPVVDGTFLYFAGDLNELFMDFFSPW